MTIPKDKFEDKLSGLYELLGAYLHEDYYVFYGSATKAVEDYLLHAEKEEVEQAIKDIDWVLRQPLTDEGLQRLLVDDLHLRYNPQFNGKTDRAWLLEVRAQLQNHITPQPKAASAATQPTESKPTPLPPLKPWYDDVPKPKSGLSKFLSDVGTNGHIVLITIAFLGGLFLIIKFLGGPTHRAINITQAQTVQSQPSGTQKVDNECWVVTLPNDDQWHDIGIPMGKNISIRPDIASLDYEIRIGALDLDAEYRNPTTEYVGRGNDILHSYQVFKISDGQYLSISKLEGQPIKIRTKNLNTYGSTTLRICIPGTPQQRKPKLKEPQTSQAKKSIPTPAAPAAPADNKSDRIEYNHPQLSRPEENGKEKEPTWRRENRRKN